MTGTYSPELVGLSLVVAIAASYVAFALSAHIATSRGWAAAYWLAGGAVAMGAGIWSMHFIGMLALSLPIPMSYEVEATAASMIIAIVVSGLALYTASVATMGRLRLAVGALIMGAGILAMHYLGMAAMQMAPPPTYDISRVIASAVIAVGASLLALSLVFNLRDIPAAQRAWKRAVGALAMGLGIGAMHYVGMSAAVFAPGTICTAPDMQVDQTWLAFVVAAATLFFLGATMLILTIDVRLANQLDAANARIAALAREDPLTHLVNRRTFLEELESAFAERRQGRPGFAVLFIDLDGFKDINDTLGHAAGDDLIVEVARRLKGCVRRGDVVSRFGGDEFAILQRGVWSPEDSQVLAEKIGEAVAARHQIGADEVAVTASIGIAQATEACSTPSQLMVRADLALYRAKDDGRHCYRFHSAELDQQMRARVIEARELQEGIERGELELSYTPQVEIATGRLVGMAASVAWQHPARGTVGAEELIPMAERTGNILAISQWLLGEACRQMRVWEQHGTAPPVLSIDISAGQLKAATGLVDDMRATASRHGLAPYCLELVFDEKVMMLAMQRYAASLDQLRNVGFRVAIRNFGEGYSSVGNLAARPVERVVIPHSSLTAAVRTSSGAEALRKLIEVGREVAADVIATGVATQGEASLLLSLGCQQAQGSLFTTRLPAMEATLLLRYATFSSVRALPSPSAA